MWPITDDQWLPQIQVRELSNRWSSVLLEKFETRQVAPGFKSCMGFFFLQIQAKFMKDNKQILTLMCSPFLKLPHGIAVKIVYKSQHSTKRRTQLVTKDYNFPLVPSRKLTDVNFLISIKADW